MRYPDPELLKELGYLTRHNAPSDGLCIVYYHFAEDDRLLYIGSTERFSKRQWTHRASSLWWEDVALITWDAFFDYGSMLLMERLAISEKTPLWNGNTKHPERILRIENEK